MIVALSWLVLPVELVAPVVIVGDEDWKEEVDNDDELVFDDGDYDDGDDVVENVEVGLEAVMVVCTNMVFVEGVMLVLTT